tara:strand:+ start:1554 stop:2117 length:564 start_codon:yes stop_codon:yes gene_type:complete
MSNLIGVTGFARSGKDTFFSCGSKYLKTFNKTSVRYAFADVLKSECDPLTLKYSGISCFTSNNREKALIRPLLVAYGTHLRRQLNPNCWIDRIKDNVQASLDAQNFVFITDVRFENEAQWILLQGGSLINVEREGVKAANPDEAEQSALIKPLISASLKWPTFGDEGLSRGDVPVATILGDILGHAV